MLVLSRLEGEELILGEPGSAVRVLVLHAGAGHVRLGIIAPRDVPVHRREVYELVYRTVESTGEVPTGRT